jgi:pyruvate dehydrogenase E1 component alpha subunit
MWRGFVSNDARAAASGVPMNFDGLIAFEADIAAEFEAGNIRTPVHLAGGNESELIEIFKDIRPQDWVLCAWRSHYHCLLKGVPPEKVKAAVMEGRSIALCFPEYRVLSSAVVGGTAPMAAGLAWSIKKRGGDERVFLFAGDMTAETGIYHEAQKYCLGHDLPVQWIIEDNTKSVCTDTEDVWGLTDWKRDDFYTEHLYRYDLTWPHVGIGKWVRF